MIGSPIIMRAISVVVEFAISYTVTGMVSVVVAKYFVDKVMNAEKNEEDEIEEIKEALEELG